jgi:hypothetical protein
MPRSVNRVRDLGRGPRRRAARALPTAADAWTTCDPALLHLCSPAYARAASPASPDDPAASASAHGLSLTAPSRPAIKGLGNQGRPERDGRPQPGVVPVGTALTGGPPDRSGRAELPHPAPTSGCWRRGSRNCFTHARRQERHADPALCPGRGPTPPVPLGRSPSLHELRRPPALVRPLPRYYDIVRLPNPVRPGRTACGLLQAIHPEGG